MAKKQPPSKTPHPSKKRQYDAYIRFSSVGFQMLATILLCAWGGVKLDEYFGTKPFLTAGLSLFGVGASMYLVFKQLTHSEKEDKQDPGAGPSETKAQSGSQDEH